MRGLQLLDACIQMFAALVTLKYKYIICLVTFQLFNCSNYVSSQEHIIQMTSLIHHSIYLLPKQECATHISVVLHV